MKMFIYIQIASLLLFSCNTIEQKKEESTNVTKISTVPPNMDTTIKYDIEGISSEGSEAVVKYINSKISEATINIYGETGQAKIIFTFSSNKIQVAEKDFFYEKDLTSVKSENDMKIKKEIIYTTDFNGKVIGNADKERLDIFQEFKKSVPFELK